MAAPWRYPGCVLGTISRHLSMPRPEDALLRRKARERGTSLAAMMTTAWREYCDRHFPGELDQERARFQEKIAGVR